MATTTPSGKINKPQMVLKNSDSSKAIRKTDMGMMMPESQVNPSSAQVLILFSDSRSAGENQEEVTGLGRAFSNVFLYADLLRLGTFDGTPHRELGLWKAKKLNLKCKAQNRPLTSFASPLLPTACSLRRVIVQRAKMGCSASTGTVFSWVAT
jgi:hypothetical protein